MVVPIYLSLGSNLGDREDNLRRALDQLEPKVHLRDISSLYETEPMGFSDQSPFLNLVASGETDLSPPQLLRHVKQVEHAVGRRPTFRWGPRVVDVDILLYGEQAVAVPQLTVPHAELRNRAFVLVPLAEIAPALRYPITGESISDLAARVPGRSSVLKLGSFQRSGDGV